MPASRFPTSSCPASRIAGNATQLLPFHNNSKISLWSLTSDEIDQNTKDTDCCTIIRKIVEPAGTNDRDQKPQTKVADDTGHDHADQTAPDKRSGYKTHIHMTKLEQICPQNRRNRCQERILHSKGSLKSKEQTGCDRRRKVL